MAQLYSFRRSAILCVFTLLTTIPDRAGTITVPGTANPWLAGMPDGSQASGDIAPAESPALFTGFSPGNNLQFTAVGLAGYNVGVETGPDGTPAFPVNKGSENGIAGQNGSLANALLGVFLDNTEPDLAGETPDPLDFNPAGALDYLTLAPKLRQPFFIGDGKTGDGAQQTIVVPAGATRLFLGITDGSGWYNNSGSFTVTISGGAASEPSLTIHQSGTNAILSWPAAAGDYSLEATTSLTSPDWQTVSATPVLTGGDQTVTEPISEASKFYRLHQKT